ncbi:putative sucrase ferredoxin domain-containing protein [Diaporthe ampelina]|uniref:Putative sucrase ferredoxin domain-containing protein n=1 Tax=Diaporthe ampelina TaxID=1214573 RepID=A0A0G2IFE1_9PEZI|nr:putative sucrase ferredoxin domain-containing protein [Diaporthe ampelina]
MFKSLVNGAKKLATGETGGTPISQLFPKVDPKVDGEDCLKDCDNCPTHYPRGFKIEEGDDLYGGVKGWSTHILVATGKADWTHNVADEKGSVMQAIEKADNPSNGRLMLSASNIPTPNHSSDYSEPTSLVLLPAFVVIENVTPSAVPTLISEYVNRSPTSTSALQPVSVTIPHSLPPPDLPEPATILQGMRSRPSPHSVLILLCSHKVRDARCGQSAPLIRKELQRHLRPLGLYRDLDDERPGGVGIYFISHVGGHKYSANVMIYRRPNAFGLDGLERASVNEGESLTPRIRKDPTDGDQGDAGAGQCIWLARVKPEDCEGIVKYTVLQGKVVKPEQQLRGGFDRSRGLMSW